jgi:hypothetical protein
MHLTSTHAAAVLLAALMALGGTAHARGAANTLTHCPWGDFGCRNPPPAAAMKGLSAPPAQARLACDPDLSTPDECWTNCKTEDDITICDIIKLDTFWPEAPPTRPGGLKAR